MKTLLTFNLNQNILNKLALLNIDIKVIDENDQNQTLGYLLNQDGFNKNNIQFDETFKEEMIVFHEFSNEDLDHFLSYLKQNNINIKLKAIVTEFNISWPATILYSELCDLLPPLN